jgi:hypothetical protein
MTRAIDRSVQPPDQRPLVSTDLRQGGSPVEGDMDDELQVRRTSDGSIDTAYYVARARRLRADSFARCAAAPNVLNLITSYEFGVRLDAF